jgi:hypothetical protein
VVTGSGRILRSLIQYLLPPKEDNSFLCEPFYLIFSCKQSPSQGEVTCLFLPLSLGANEVLLVVGGFGSQQSPIDVVEKYDPKTQEWSFLPVSRGGTISSRVEMSLAPDTSSYVTALRVEKPQNSRMHVPSSHAVAECMSLPAML